jgi:hypothetical protein
MVAAVFKSTDLGASGALQRTGRMVKKTHRSPIHCPKFPPHWKRAGPRPKKQDAQGQATVARNAVRLNDLTAR